MESGRISKKCIVFIYGFLFFNLLWLIAAEIIKSPVLVSPIDVYLSLGNILQSGMFLHIIASLIRVVEGLLLSLLIGIPVGLFLSSSPKINKICSPLVYFSYPIPKLALLPLVMLMLGIGESAKVTMIVLILVFQIIIATRDGVLHISKESFHVVRSLGASKIQILRWVTLPAIIPEVLTNLRIAVGTALSVLFFMETYGTERGMGFYIMDAWMRLSYTQMYAGILILSLIGFLLFFMIDLIEDFLCKWKNVDK